MILLYALANVNAESWYKLTPKSANGRRCETGDKAFIGGEL